MNKVLLAFLIIFALMQLIQTEQENFPIDDAKVIKAPTEIMTMLETSCFDCHSNQTNWPWYSKIAPFSWVISSHVNDGRRAVNYSEWEDYTEKEKLNELEATYRTVYAVMPLSSYLWLHPKADLTKEQRKQIREWTGVRNRN